MASGRFGITGQDRTGQTEKTQGEEHEDRKVDHIEGGGV